MVQVLCFLLVVSVASGICVSIVYVDGSLPWLYNVIKSSWKVNVVRDGNMLSFTIFVKLFLHPNENFSSISIVRSFHFTISSSNKIYPRWVLVCLGNACEQAFSWVPISVFVLFTSMRGSSMIRFLHRSRRNFFLFLFFVASISSYS